MFNYFGKYCLTHGAMIRPLNLPNDDNEYVGTCNPSVFIDNGRVRLILRKVNYALWNCDDEYKFTTQYGPLWYITKDGDGHLRTKNYLCEINDNGFVSKLINTEKFDKEPLWEFVGLEDARLVRWNGKLYGTGVRRDTTTNGQGRMELSELDEDGNEISRVRIKAPGDDSSYCEKNWMPILDMPYHYVKWCEPVEVVKANPETGECESVLFKHQPADLEYYNTNNMHIRGSSQVIPWGEYRIAITHLCELWINEKKQKSGAGYFEQFIVWDKDWNIIKMSEPFRFAGFGVEFTNGLAYDNGKFYIPFALQDNFSYMIEINEDIISNFIFNNNKEYGPYSLNGNAILEFFDKPCDSYNAARLGQLYYNDGYNAPSMVLFERACEYNTFKSKEDLYDIIYMCGKSIANMGNRNDAELGLWNKLIDLDMFRSEGYYMMSLYYTYRNRVSEAYTFAKLAYQLNNFKLGNVPDRLKIDSVDCEIQYIMCLYYTENYLDCIPMLEQLKASGKPNKKQLGTIDAIMEVFTNNQKNKVRVL